LLDRNQALPDARALARLYRNNELVDRLPEDDEHPLVVIPKPVPAVPVDHAPPGRPPLSPVQIREVMNELQAQFPSRTYRTFEARPLPEDVIPMPNQDADEEAGELEGINQPFYILGALLLLAVVGVLVYLALNGQLLSHPPAGGATPAPSVSAPR